MSLANSANAPFSLAFDFINRTSRSVFLTGKAGTGKTTFLKYVCDHTRKNFMVAAPTGVAAINAGGVTLHSLFQLPLGIYLPEFRLQECAVPVTNRNTLFKNLRLGNNKRNALQELELLIIDEVSMVRCDMLDAVDAILRAVRKNPKPFGGVQVLFIGDLFQLSPVAGNDEWSLLREHYESPFFFHAKAVQLAPPLSIELTKIYRQSEQKFIDLLNNIRNNEVTSNDFDLLNSRRVNIVNTEGFVTLTTHNYKADEINERELDKLPGDSFRFSAIVEGDFPERNCPTDSILVLKTGARIMFIKNDSSEEKSYYNGKLATVIKIDEETVTILFDEGKEFELTKETWRNIRYKYNSEDDEIEEEELGSFTQFPIRLAWAITIHKSQGLTFQKAIIDAGSSFAPGQVYVALSRCTSLSGLILLSPITAAQIATNPVVVAYSQGIQNENVLKSELQQSIEEYEKEYFLDLFNFYKIQQAIDDWAEELPRRKLPNLNEVLAFSKELKERSRELEDVAAKTQQWIGRNFNEARSTGEYERLINGLSRSVNHFNETLHDQFFEKLQQHNTSLKGKSKVKKYQQTVRELAAMISTKAKKIRQASWQNEVLFTGNSKPFTELHQVKEVKSKGSSSWETFALFQQGLDIQKIAEMRGLAISTIEGHLLDCIRAGKLQIEQVVKPEKINTIMEAISSRKEAKPSEIKALLGNDYSYSEIRAVFFHLEKLSS